MSVRLTVLLLASLSMSASVSAAEYLVRFHSNEDPAIRTFSQKHGGKLELVSSEGALYKWTTSASVRSFWDPSVQYVQKNKTIRIFQNPSIVANRDALLKALEEREAEEDFGAAFPDNPEIKTPPVAASGTDSLLDKAWGLLSIDGINAWKKTPQGKGIIVAVTDTGVDYNHVDLIANMWRNKNEVLGNGKDDDNNGYVDDIVGWDFAMNDNKPYDLSLDLLDILFKGGNPGHGTHVAGVIGAGANNSIGIAGVAPQAQIMALRFIKENGQGETAAAIKAIDYAVANGARVINASWGGEKGSDGEDDDKALLEAVERAEKKGVIFVAAAGNGRVNPSTMTAAGFDNDSDAKPIVPASFNVGNIVTVAAIDSSEALAPFSNWGLKSVHLGAPGVKVLSTVPGDRYQDTVVDIGSIKATWDGTSMAAPHVAGAIAVVWSAHPDWTVADVKKELLALTKGTTSLGQKVVTEGRLSLTDIK